MRIKVYTRNLQIRIALSNRVCRRLTVICEVFPISGVKVTFNLDLVAGQHHHVRMKPEQKQRSDTISTVKKVV